MTPTNFTPLLEEWKKLYKRADTISRYLDQGGDWESLCFGWCLAKGLTLKECDSFYQLCITEGVF